MIQPVILWTDALVFLLVVVVLVGWASLKSAGVFDKAAGRDLNPDLFRT